MNWQIEESSGLSLEGSFTRDLTISKVWLINQIEKIKTDFSAIYILGSWYANLSLYIKLNSKITAKKIVNVESNKEFLDIGEKILKLAKVSNDVESMLKDVNQLDYRQLKNNGLVINTSIDDILGKDWFNNIPAGNLVALQSRTNDKQTKFNSDQDLASYFPLDTVLYSGSMKLQDPESQYKRFMVIGIK